MIQLIKLIITILFLCIQTLLFSQNQKENFVGKWKAPKGAIIIISILGDSFIGKTEKEKVIVLKDVELIKEKWQGVILNPKEHIIAQCELILYPTKLKIIVKKGMFHKTLYWTKIL